MITMMKLFSAFFLLVGALEVAAGDTTSITDSAAAGASDSELSAKVRAHLSKLTTLSNGSPNPRVTCTAGIKEAGKRSCSNSPYLFCALTLIRLAHLSFSSSYYFAYVYKYIHSRLHRRRDGTDWSLAAR
jgi:hypothetical protein